MSVPRSFDALVAAAGMKANTAEPTLEITAEEAVIIFANMAEASDMGGHKIATEHDVAIWRGQCLNGQAEWGGCKLIIKH